MWIRSSTLSTWTPKPKPKPKPRPVRRSPRNRLAAAAGLALLAATACADPEPARAQVVVFDPRNHLENALQAARQLESLANEARALANQARSLSASPYSHLAGTSATLNDIGELARAAKGIAADMEGLQRDFERLYPAAVEGLDPREALRRSRARDAAARETAQDLARTAAELDRLSRTRAARLSGALSASEAAAGQTAAIQSSTQVLAVLAEDLGSMRAVMLAQSRLMAEAAARQATDRAAAAEARRRFWGRESTTPANPDFDPLPHARK